MTRDRSPITILLADDDLEDRQLASDALTESAMTINVRMVQDGEELMNYLHRRGDYADPAASPRPGLILLDLVMPKKDGREVLAEIKRDLGLRTIPVIVMTTSSANEDVCRSYELGASSYVTKPVSFAALVAIMKTIGAYWFGVVELPS
jgi:CheY-like chemotaxis protein